MPRTAGSARTPDRGVVLSCFIALALAPQLLVGSCAADAAAWGRDHVGKPLPDYIVGDECLFCHRKKVGPGWETEAHSRTIHETKPGQFVLGERSLKEAGFGRLSILSEGKWDEDRFGPACAGCHTTAVKQKTGRFEAVSLDCFVCHGDTPREHTESPQDVYLSPRRMDSPRVVVSICGQCHLRGGRSRATGRPYATHFVAGDNLFRDFDVDLSDAALERASTADRHVLENVRNVLRGEDRMTCLSCHSIHRASSTKHMRLPDHESCYTCHVRGASKEELRPFTRGSSVCEY